MLALTNEATVLSDKGTEDEGGDSHKLDENVDGWTGGILEGITDGITTHGILVLRALLENNTLTVLRLAPLLLFSIEMAGFDALLGVVPGTTGVGGGEGNLDTRSNGTSKHTGNESVTEKVAEDEWGQDHDGTWGNHLL